MAASFLAHCIPWIASDPIAWLCLLLFRGLDPHRQEVYHKILLASPGEEETFPEAEVAHSVLRRFQDTSAEERCRQAGPPSQGVAPFQEEGREEGPFQDADACQEEPSQEEVPCRAVHPCRVEAPFP